jgi:long-chain acyl-CoA synthetase
MPADAGALTLPTVAEDDPALVVFTSGSTGRPKGALLSHHGIIASQQNLLASTGRLPHTLAPDHRPIVSLMTSPLFHLSGVGPLITAMLVGGTMVFLEGRLEPAEVLELIERESVTVWGAVPTAVQRVLAHPDLARYDVSSLRTIGLGGAPMPPGLGERIRVAFPTVRRGASQIYGMTETNGIVASASGAEMTAHPGTTGRPMPVVEVRVDQPDAEGHGEILVRGPTVMLGYLGDGAESPIRDDGFLRTGDVGRLDADGYLYVTGRVKDIIIRGGENVGAGHVEQVIGELPQVREVAVVGLPHPELGEEVAAAVVLSQPQTTVDDLRAGARQRLAYFEVPTRWWLRADDLPTTRSGKIDKTAIVRDWPAGD